MTTASDFLPRDCANSVAVFAALGDENRFDVVTRLCAVGPLSLTKLAEGRPVSRQAIAKHLQILADAGLIHGSRRGRESVWTLTPRGFARSLELLERISREWDATVDRLRCYVEDTNG